MIRLALLFIPVFGMFWVFNAIYSLAVKLEKLHFKSGLRQRESGVQNALVACCIFCCSWLVGWIPLAGFILCIIAFTCFYRAMCTMKEQALDILNKRQRMDYFPFPPSGPPEVPRELRKFAYRRGPDAAGCWSDRGGRAAVGGTAGIQRRPDAADRRRQGCRMAPARPFNRRSRMQKQLRVRKIHCKAPHVQEKRFRNAAVAAGEARRMIRHPAGAASRAACTRGSVTRL